MLFVRRENFEGTLRTDDPDWMARFLAMVALLPVKDTTSSRTTSVEVEQSDHKGTNGANAIAKLTFQLQADQD